MKDLFAQAKAKPGKLTYGMSGLGSIQHLFGEYLKKETNIDLVPIPYKGDAPTLTDLMGGQIDLAFGSPQITVPLINSGKLRAIAVTSAKRLGNLPDVPTIAESGVPGYDESVWTGFAVPSGTPAGIVKKLHESIRGAILSTEFKRAAEETGAELIASTQEYAVQFVRTEFERYRQIVKDLNLKVE
jgi:tripartite-type tricarboxylate transporter receptor subunit TctC